MPIKDKSLYPADWPAISQRIRERDGQQCKRCGVANGAWILRSTEDGARYLVYQDGDLYTPDGEPIHMGELDSEYADSKDIKVVLTVAHLDHDPANNADENLAALCQRCHLMHDAKQHARNAAETRRQRYINQTGQMEMFK